MPFIIFTNLKKMLNVDKDETLRNKSKEGSTMYTTWDPDKICLETT